MSGVILSLQCPKICCFSFLPLRRSHTTFCGSVPRQLIKATSDIQNSKDVLYKKKKKKVVIIYLDCILACFLGSPSQTSRDVENIL